LQISRQELHSLSSLFTGTSGALAFGNFGLKGAHLSSDMIFFSFHWFSSPRACYCLATMDGGFKVHMSMKKPLQRNIHRHMGLFLGDNAPK